METIVCKLVIFIVTLYFNDATAAVKYSPQITRAVIEERSLKKSLGYEEDVYLNFRELAEKYNYKSEEHTVVTEDGYILTIFRILSKCDQVKPYPVFLMHGIYDSSDGWIVNGPGKGLGYILSEKCHDVWAANHRGNVYSRRHVTLNPDKDLRFWNYSFDEHGIYDIPAMIDYVLKVTQKTKVIYIGHSQGTTGFLVMCSLRPEYNQKIHISFLMGPVAWFANIKNPLLSLVAPNYREAKALLDAIGKSELLAKHQPIHEVMEFLCVMAPRFLCSAALSLFTGYTIDYISPRYLSVAFGHVLVGTSSKSLAHYGQLIVSKKFERYNEGPERNMQRYGSTHPPEYNLTLVTSPVVLLCGQSDWLSSIEDVNILSSKLPNLLESYIVPDVKWSHNDHLWGVNASKNVYFKILEWLDKYT